MRLIVRRHCSWKKKERNFHAKRHTFWRTRARERVHIYTEVDKMSGNTDVEKGNFAVKAGLAQVRDSHPRELARFSSVDGFSFLLRRRRHLFFSLLLRVTSFFFFCSSFFFFVRRLIIHSSQQREFKRKKSVDEDLEGERGGVSLLSPSFVRRLRRRRYRRREMLTTKMREGTSLFFFIRSFFVLSMMSEKKKLNIIDRFS